MVVCGEETEKEEEQIRGISLLSSWNVDID